MYIHLSTYSERSDEGVLLSTTTQRCIVNIPYSSTKIIHIYTVTDNAWPTWEL